MANMLLWHHGSHRTRVLPLGLLLAWCAVPASAQDPPRANAAALPGLSELRTGWNVLRPGGETKCAKGGEYAFSVRPGASDKLLVWFEGGGACWRGEQCVREQFYRPHQQRPSSARQRSMPRGDRELSQTDQIAQVLEQIRARHVGKHRVDCIAAVSGSRRRYRAFGVLQPSDRGIHRPQAQVKRTALAGREVIG